MNPIVRFAPSPTGQLHIGGVRTALFNYAFAKKHDGTFLIRIEDTDKERSKDEYTVQILDSLKWLGLEFKGEPIKQSTRTERYNEVINYLLETGNAYRCFTSGDELQKLREKSESYLYPGIWRDRSTEEIESKLKDGAPFTIRLRIPESGKVDFEDLVYDKISTDISELDDFIIARSDGSPTYNLTVVVDDHDMDISHVIRGEDHISNTPKQLMIYKAMNWDSPAFGHLPMILGSDGKRLSKRHGAKGTQAYKDLGYFSDSLINYLALLGWNPGNEDEIFNLQYLIENFSFDRVNKKSAVFDTVKLDWVSSQNIMNKSTNELIDLIKDFDSNWLNEDFSDEYLRKVIVLIKERLKTLSDVKTNSDYFFNDPKEYDEKSLQKCWNESTSQIIEDFYLELEKISTWNSTSIDELIASFVKNQGIGFGKLMQPLRVALTGALIGPSIPDMIELLELETCKRRFQNILDFKLK